MDRHELADRGASCISPATEPDGKLRNPPRRRVPVAVSTSYSMALLLPLILFPV